MNNTDARMCVALLQGYFPRSYDQLPESTVEIWASEFEAFEVEDVMVAVQQLGRTSKNLPSLQDVLEEATDARNARSMRRRRALPEGESDGVSFAEYLETHPEMRERAARVGLGRGDGAVLTEDVASREGSS